MKTNFKKLSDEDIIFFVESLGQKPYKAKQIINWIYKRKVISFDDMTDLSIDFRNKLNETALISNLKLIQTQVSGDGTEKLLFELEDGETVESVLIPNTLCDTCYTLCISSQVGCAMGCKFCATGKLGLKRNLRAYEIFDQVIASKRYIESKSQNLTPNITNIVLMGMGEPFNNINEVIKALWKMTGPMGFSKKRITVSTAGIVPGFQKLAAEGPGVNIAISLNATTDAARSSIMPVNKKYPLKNLLDACRKFPLSPGRKLTFEYVMLAGINDSEEDALRIIKLLKGMKSKVNLIPYNPGSNSLPELAADIELIKPSDDRVLKFKEILQRTGLAVFVRKSKGSDIAAACGQLKALYK